MKEIVPGSVQRVEKPGMENCWQLATVDEVLIEPSLLMAQSTWLRGDSRPIANLLRFVLTVAQTLVFQCMDADDVGHWLGCIEMLLKERGDDAEVNAYLEDARKDPARSMLQKKDQFGRYSIRFSEAAANASSLNESYDKKHALATTIESARATVATARKMQHDNHVAHASVLLTLEILKMINALQMYQGSEEDNEVKILRAMVDEHRELESVRA
jgi:hypothetical protein